MGNKTLKLSDERPKYMRSDDIRRLAKNYRNRLDPMTSGGTLYESTCGYGHMDKHVGMSKVEIMDQLLERTMTTTGTRSGKMPSCANSFATERTARTDIIEGMYHMAEDIAAWRYDSHVNARAHDPLVLYIPMLETEDFLDPDPDVPPMLPGNAFRQTKDDISTCHNTTLVLVLSPLYGSHDDFRLTTSYPMTESDIEPYHENDTLDIIRQTNAYKNASPFWKTVFEYKGKEKPENRPFAKVSEKHNSFIISCRNPEKDREDERGAGLGAVFIVYDDGNIKYRHERAGEQYKPPISITPENAAEYAMLYPEQMEIAQSMSKRIRELSMSEEKQKQPEKHTEKESRKPDIPKKKKTKRPAAYSTKSERGRENNITYETNEDDYVP